MYFIHTDTMTVIKAIYSPILATFLVGGMCVLFPLLKFERTEGGRVNSYLKPIQSKASIINIENSQSL